MIGINFFLSGVKKQIEMEKKVYDRQEESLKVVCDDMIKAGIDEYRAKGICETSREKLKAESDSKIESLEKIILRSSMIA